MLTVTNLIGFGGSILPQLTYVGNTSTSSATSGNAWTFSGLGLGESRSKLLVFTIMGNDASGGTNGTINSVTLDGNSCTLAAKTNVSDKWQTGIYYRVVSSGSTGTLVVNMSGSYGRASVGVYMITNYNSATPYDVDDTDVSISTTVTNSGLDIPNGGVVITSLHTAASGWTQNYFATHDFLNSPDSQHHYSYGVDGAPAETGKSITATSGSSFQNTMVTAIWR
jgi:hypothetical protein